MIWHLVAIAIVFGGAAALRAGETLARSAGREHPMWAAYLIVFLIGLGWIVHVLALVLERWAAR